MAGISAISVGCCSASEGPQQGWPGKDEPYPPSMPCFAILKWKSWVAVPIAMLLLFAPQILLIQRFSNRIYTRVSDVPQKEYGVVFGAYVDENQVPSDAAYERIEAAIWLYQEGKIQKVFISNDNRYNQATDALALYAQKRGVVSEDIIVDRLGIDTHDTCQHLAKIASACFRHPRCKQAKHK